MDRKGRIAALAKGMVGLEQYHSHLRLPDDPQNYRDGIDTSCPGPEECETGKYIRFLAEMLQEEIDKQEVERLG